MKKINLNIYIIERNVLELRYALFFRWRNYEKLTKIWKKNTKLKNEIKDKEQIVNDLMNLNIELQNKVIQESTKVYEISRKVQTKVLNNFNELMCKYSHR